MTGKPYQRARRRGTAAAVLLVVAYFLVPVEPDPNGPRLALRSLATLVMVLAVAWLVTRQVGRQLAAAAAPDGAGEISSLIRLAVALLAGLLAFALGDYVIARTRPGQFSGLETRIDALYFSLTTLTTVGYGDVHAAGQVARVAVCLQMVFSIGVIATGVSLVVKQLTRRPGRD